MNLKIKTTPRIAEKLNLEGKGTVQKEPHEDDKPGTRSFPITDPLLIQKLDSLSPEEMENLQKILVESMKELREKHSVKIGNGFDEPEELKP